MCGNDEYAEPVVKKPTKKTSSIREETPKPRPERKLPAPGTYTESRRSC